MKFEVLSKTEGGATKVVETKEFDDERDARLWFLEEISMKRAYLPMKLELVEVIVERVERHVSTKMADRRG